MNKIVALTLTMLLSISIISDCHPQNYIEGQEVVTVDGRVVKVDASHSTITIKAVNKLTFSVPMYTPITSDIYDIKLSDIEPGDDVTVEYYEDPSGKLIATGIAVQNREI